MSHSVRANEPDITFTGDFKNLFLSEEGIIIGLLGFEEEVKVVWWRSDRLGVEKG